MTKVLLDQGDAYRYVPGKVDPTSLREFPTVQYGVLYLCTSTSEHDFSARFLCLGWVNP